MSVTNDSSDHIIAGIGASADGIHAMEVFFANLPENTGISFVIIQHLSPEHKSILPEIIQRRTKLKVQYIEDRSSPEPDHVYVLPAGFDVTLSGNRFRLQKYGKNKKGLHLPIDLFFRTLATSYKTRSAAILLSGAGSDGCLGIKEIKNYGGLVMVQDPGSAKFKSMPQNAIDTGLVEKIARPEELPGLLMEFKRKCIQEGEPIKDDGSQDQMRKLLMLLTARTGHDFSGYKENTVHRRIRRIMTLHKFENFRDYVFFLEKYPEEIDRLFRELLIGMVHLASIVESSDDAIFSESTEGEILSWNDGAVQLYGYSEKEALRLMSHDLYFNPEDSEDRNMITKVKKGLKVKNQEAAHKGKDGRMIPVSVTKSPIRDDKGRIIAISNIVKDITSTKEREKELVRANETTEQMAGLKSMFLANMSHEIRTPLNSILGFADMLKREVIEGKPGRYVENINNSGKQLLHLINDIVDVSRLDAGELPIHLSNVNICELMRRTKEQFEGYATENQNTDLDFRLKLPESEGDFFIVTDEHRLQQILKNLLSNAFKYTSEGYIEFGFEFRNRKKLLFFVCDTGTGISSENHEKIFDRFQQVENSSEYFKKVIRGTGLGLAIARGLTERLGGKMWVNSILGKGSVFYFTIPYEEGESVNDASDVVAEETVKIPRFDGKKILIADDDPYSLEMLKIMLEDTKISMFVAIDGHQVMDIYNREEVDILLLDIRMPGKDGYELAKNIRIDNPGIPMIAQSAFAMPEQIKKSLDMGFNRHLVKPLNRDTLYSSLEAYL